MLKSCFAHFAKLQIGLKALMPLILITIYTLFGGFLFHFLESPNEIKQIAVLRQERVKAFDEALHQIATKMDSKAYERAYQSLRQFRRQLLEIEPNCAADSISEQRHWTFLGSIYFCITVYTTIGYGNQAPTTALGRAFTIVYAIFGIPLALIALISLGSFFLEICMNFFNFLLRFHPFGSRTKKIQKSKKIDNNEGGKGFKLDNDLSLQFPIWFLTVTVIVWVLLCAFLFTKLEGWNYDASLYFVLISFLSIGFGDIYPSKSENAYWSILLIAVMLFVGLALVYAILALIQKHIQSLAEKHHFIAEEKI